MLNKNIIKGKIAENLFIELLHQLRPNKYIYSADTWQNIQEHWDVAIKDNNNQLLRIDVKDRKNINLSDNYTVIELKNVQGRKGWLFGHADYIAFRSGDTSTFLLTPLEPLKKYVKSNVDTSTIVYNVKDAINVTYTRGLDLISVIDMNQLLSFSYILKSN